MGDYKAYFLIYQYDGYYDRGMMIPSKQELERFITKQSNIKDSDFRVVAIYEAWNSYQCAVRPIQIETAHEVYRPDESRPIGNKY